MVCNNFSSVTWPTTSREGSAGVGVTQAFALCAGNVQYAYPPQSCPAQPCIRSEVSFHRKEVGVGVAPMSYLVLPHIP